MSRTFRSSSLLVPALRLGAFLGLSMAAPLHAWQPAPADWQVEVVEESDLGLSLRVVLDGSLAPGEMEASMDPEAAPVTLSSWLALPTGMEARVVESMERWSTEAPGRSAWSLGGPVGRLGARFDALAVHPVAQDGAVLEELALRVEFVPAGEGASAPTRPAASQVQRERRRLAALNSGLLERREADRTQDLPMGRYLVVGKGASLPYVAEWADWRRRQGYDVDIRSTESLGVTGNDWGPIHDVAQDLYEGDGLDYLLLVGDMNIDQEAYHVPGDLVPGGQYAEFAWGRNIVTDHSLALLEGDDYFSDILVGRLPADNATQLSVMMGRQLQYDRQPVQVDDGWTRRGLMIYDVSAAGSRRETSMAIRQRLLEIGFADVDTIRNHRYSNPLPPAVVTSALNEGRTVVNYRGFGYREKWNGPQFGVDQMGDLSNYGMYPLVTSIVCGGGDFANTNYDPCLGEGFLRAGSPQEPTGAIGFIGPSEEDTHTKWNNALNMGIYQALLRENVRELGALLEAGKAELWTCFPNDRDEVWFEPGSASQANNVCFYFYAYNLLGDPGARLRMGHQRSLAAPEWSHPVPGSSRVELTLKDTLEQPAEAVWVCLSDAEGGRLALARSDAQGRVALDTAPLPAAELTLTAHGDDWTPWTESFTPSQPDSWLELREWSLADGQADVAAGDTLALVVTLEELGAQGTAEGLTLRLESAGGHVELLTDSLALPAVEPGGEVVAAELRARLTDSVVAGESLGLSLNLRSGGQLLWSRTVALSAAGATPVLTGLATDPQTPQAGAQAELLLQLRNDGTRPLDAVAVRLYSLSTAVEVVNGDAPFEPVDQGAEGDAGPWVVQIHGDVLDGSRPGLEAVFFRADGSTAARLPFTLAVGTVTLADPVGPDDHGYLIYHDEDAGDAAPDYQWVNIAQTGTEVILNDEGVAFNEDGLDGATVAVPLPFSFRFYGQDYDTLTICSNGWLAMGDQREHYLGLNTPIPGAQGPDAMIAVFWADLYNYYLNSRFGHCYMFHDAEQHLFIVQWNNFQHTGHPYQDNWFQAVLRDPAHWPTPTGDGEILLQYQDMILTMGDHFFTVGIERPDQRSGLQYVFNNEYGPAAQPITNQTALLITTAPRFEETAVDPTVLPRSLEILAATPNPFNPSTQLTLRLPQAGRLVVDVFNLRGERVRRLHDGATSAGTRSIRFDAEALGAGMYFVEARLGGLRAVRQVTYLP